VLFPVHSLEYASGEHHFIKRLGFAGRYVTQGDTTPEIRRDRLREMIIAGNLQNTTMWTRHGSDETFRAAWERFFQVPFHLDGSQ
jgi:hypothetical protein